MGEPAGADPPAVATTGAVAVAGTAHAAAYDGPPELALCTLVPQPPAGSEWLAEIKYDGYRVTVAVREGDARVYLRSGEDATKRFERIAKAAAALPCTDALLDGEAVVFDERGVSDFGSLQKALGSDPDAIVLVAFDLLQLNGYDVRSLPTTGRKELLATLLADEPEDGPIRYAHEVDGDAPALFEAACAQGLEGVVAKRASAPYPTGRTRTWLKTRCKRAQEFVVGGYTSPEGSRAGFGALLLGYYDEAGSLTYAGRVGSGFSERDLDSVARQLEPLVVDEAPFAGTVPAEGRRLTWVAPHLVAQVRFLEWTSDGRLRQPVFLGLREDKDPRLVVREHPESPPEVAPEADVPRESDGSVAGIRISNPAKRLFPGSSLDKLALARYYEAVAPWMLPEVGERPLTLVRCPVGEGRGTCFYQRHPDRGLPPDVHALTHTLTAHDESDEWLWIDSVAGLVALAQMGCAEIHTWSSRIDHPDRPDRIIFDLDPGPGVAWPQIAETARIVADELRALGFSPFVKSTGSKGLHVVAPIEPVWDFERIRALARTLAERIAAQHPQTVTPRMAKSQRGGRIFLDYVRNAQTSSSVAPYSTRFLGGPPVAVPLEWDELTDTLDIRTLTTDRVLQRVRSGIDPWRSLASGAAGVGVLKAAEQSLSD